MSTSASPLADSRSVGMEPVEPQNRILTLDIIRGLGVLGMLLVNIESFAMVTVDRTVPVASGDKEPANLAIWFLTHVCADGRFMTVFSLLFGAGICMMSHRSERKAIDPRPAHFRRMGFLILIGMLHAHLLWSGDILFAYGVCGSVCWFLRRLSPARLLASGAFFLSIGSVVSWNSWSSQNGFLVELYQVVKEYLHIPQASSTAGEMLIYRGGWFEQMARRAPEAFNAELIAFWLLNFWRISGVFLLGMALFKSGFLIGALRKGAYRAALALAAAASLVSASVGYVELLADTPSANSVFVDFVVNYWLSLPIGIGWISIGIVLAKNDSLTPVRTALQSVGRMAFTNYILQTLFCTTLFYGHGFGLFGYLDRMRLLGIVVLIWTVEIIGSHIWLRYFAFGPIEWLQRYVAYWRRPTACLPPATATAL